MQTVPRHAIDADFAKSQAASLKQAAHSSLAYIEKKSDALGDAFWQSLMWMEYQLGYDPRAAQAETWQAAVLASQVSGAIFAVSVKSEGSVTYEVGKPVTLNALGPNRLSTADNWITAAWLAVVLQDETRIQELCSVTPYTLRASGAKLDDYIYPWVQTLQTFLRHEKVPAELFTTVMERTSPESLQYTTPEFMLHIVYPPIKMFYYLLRRDAEKFNEALVQALTLHRDYWSVEDLATEPDGFVALGPLAISILARSVGMSIDVESEYLPSNMLSGTRPSRDGQSS